MKMFQDLMFNSGCYGAPCSVLSYGNAITTD